MGMFIIADFVSMVRRIRQPDSHILARKTSWQGLPMASSFGMPVICSAALLNESMRQFRSTVKTPSAILSRMIRCCSFKKSSDAFIFKAVWLSLPGLAPPLTSSGAVVSVLKAGIHFVPFVLMRSVQIEASRHYNAIGLFNQTINFL